MLLAELELRHSRAVAPTRRIALGELWLPTDPAPGFGGILLGAMVAHYAQLLDDDEREQLVGLIDVLDANGEIAQPQLRHRFQTDDVGLDRSTYRLLGEGNAMGFMAEHRATPTQTVLGAAYATAALPEAVRHYVFRSLRRCAFYVGSNEEQLLRFVATDEYVQAGAFMTLSDSIWALRVLGFLEDDEPSRNDVLKRFRVMVRDVHPDSGGERSGAGTRVTELLQAKRILLATAS